jgi:predicted  nucleic acid-binding Zn-ribbon protein
VSDDQRDTTDPARICEGCHGTFPANTPRWYVDPDGVELCPECADDLYATWKMEGLADAE